MKNQFRHSFIENLSWQWDVLTIRSLQEQLCGISEKHLLGTIIWIPVILWKDTPSVASGVSARNKQLFARWNFLFVHLRSYPSMKEVKIVHLDDKSGRRFAHERYLRLDWLLLLEQLWLTKNMMRRLDKLTPVQ